MKKSMTAVLARRSSCVRSGWPRVLLPLVVTLACARGGSAGSAGSADGAATGHPLHLETSGIPSGAAQVTVGGTVSYLDDAGISFETKSLTLHAPGSSAAVDVFFDHPTSLGVQVFARAIDTSGTAIGGNTVFTLNPVLIFSLLPLNKPGGFLQPGPCAVGLTESTRSQLCTVYSMSGGCTVPDCMSDSVPGAACVDLSGSFHPSVDAYECELACAGGGSCPAGLTCHPPYSAPGFCVNYHPAQPPVQVKVQASLSGVPAAAVRIDLDVQVRMPVPGPAVSGFYWSAEVRQSLPGGAATASTQVSIAAWPANTPVWGVFSALAYDAQGGLVAATDGKWNPSDLALAGAMVPLNAPGAFLEPGPCLPGLTLSPNTALCTAAFSSASCDGLPSCVSEAADAFRNNGCLVTSQPPAAPASECARFCSDPFAPCPAGQVCKAVGGFTVCAH